MGKKLVEQNPGAYRSLSGPGIARLVKQNLARRKEKKSSRNQERPDKKTRNHRETGKTEDNAEKRTKQSEMLTLALRKGALSLQL